MDICMFGTHLRAAHMAGCGGLLGLLMLASNAMCATISYPRAPQSLSECDQAHDEAMTLYRAEHDAGLASSKRRDDVGKEEVAACGRRDDYLRCSQPYDELMARIHKETMSHFAERDRISAAIGVADRICRQQARAEESRSLADAGGVKNSANGVDAFNAARSDLSSANSAMESAKTGSATAIVVGGIVKPAGSALVDSAYARRNDGRDGTVAAAFDGADALRSANGAVNPIAAGIADNATRRARSMAEQTSADMRGVLSQIDSIGSGNSDSGTTSSGSGRTSSGTPVIISSPASSDGDALTRKGDGATSALLKDAVAMADLDRQRAEQAQAARDALERQRVRTLTEGSASEISELADRQQSQGRADQVRESLETLIRRFPSHQLAAVATSRLAADQRAKALQLESQRNAAAEAERRQLAAVAMENDRLERETQRRNDETREAIQIFGQGLQNILETRGARGGSSSSGPSSSTSAPCPPGKNLVNGACRSGVAQ